MKRIALFMQSLEGGGVQKVMVGIANGFAKANIGSDIDLLVGDAGGAMRTELTDEINIIDFGKKKYHGDYKILASMRHLISYMRQSRECIVIAAPGFASVAAIVAKLLTGAKVIIIIDDRLSLLKSRGIKGWISFTLYYMTFRFADTIVAAHDSAAKDAVNSLRIANEKVRTIYHPLINPELIRHTKPISNEIEDFLGKEDTLLVAAGRLTWVKDYQNLIKAFGLVAAKYHNTKLVILGEGPDSDELSRLIHEQNLGSRVCMYGYADDPLAFMKRAAVCVSSSRQEAFGITLVEALACGTTVVATDCSSGGPREILEDGRFGYLCPVEDSKALAKAIEKALKSPIAEELAIKRGTQFSIEASVKKYMALIDEVAIS